MNRIKQNLFKKYLQENEIILTEQNIKKILCFFDRENDILFLDENIKNVYHKRKNEEVKLSEKAKNNIEIFLTWVENQEKLIKEKNRNNLINSASKANIIDFGENYQPAKKNKVSLYKVLGTPFYGYRGISAINKLLEEQKGYIPNAFEREDIGAIDLVWGHYNSGGLSHIIYRRDNQNINIERFLYELTDVIENGQMHFNRENNKIEIYKSGKMAIVSFMIEKNNTKFLLSGFKRRK